jgi:hypothetical protein
LKLGLNRRTDNSLKVLLRFRAWIILDPPVPSRHENLSIPERSSKEIDDALKKDGDKESPGLPAKGQYVG